MWICPGISDPNMNRLAKCTANNKSESNLRRNLHAMLVRTGRQLGAKISWIPCPVRVVKGARIKKQIVNWPVVLFSDWIKTVLTNRPELLLGGNQATETSEWHSLFDQFWNDYQCCDPSHPVFTQVEEAQRCLFLPFTFHGDEGRGRNKVPVLIESFCPLISYKGIRFTNLSGTLGL